MISVKKVLGLQDSYIPEDTQAHHGSDPTVLDWLNDGIPSVHQALQCLTRLFPFLKWIQHYNLQWFIGDLVAGATVGAVVIPQSMGYARLAGLPVEYGLYTSFMGGVVYWFFATSKDITIGPVAVMSTVVGTIITDLQQLYPSIPGPQIALSITVICGSIITFMGLARIGFLVDFIPLPSITSFMTGSAITIGAGQVKTLLGQTADYSTRAPAYQIIIDTLKNLPSSQRYDAAMGVSALVTLYTIRTACNYAAGRFPHRSKLFFFLPALRSAFVILFFTMISAAVNLHRRENPAFAIVGHVPRGFQHAGVPNVTGEVIKTFAAKLPACVIVLLLEHIAISKSFGRLNNYTIDPSQELIAIGITNLLGPFLGAYSATGAFCRSAIQSKSGVRTPLAGVITATVVLIAIYALTAVVFYIPLASLSSVIFHAVGDLIVAPNTIYQFWLIAPLDAVVFAVGLVVAITNTIPNSIYATACLSIAVLLFRHAKAPGSLLGRTWIGGQFTQRPLFLPLNDAGDGYLGVELERPRPGVFIYRFSEGFNYLNAGHYLDPLVQTISRCTRRTNAQAYSQKGDRPWNDLAPENQGHASNSLGLPVLRAIILDFSAVNHVDVTSIQNLVDIRSQLNHRAAPLEVQWHFAHVRNRWTKRALAASGFGYPSCHNAEPLPVDELKDSSRSHGRHTPLDVEANKEEPLNKGDEKWMIGPEANVCNDTPRSVAIESASRPFFHADLTSALESVDAYLAANPVP
ncbi:sulfate anion transporter [Penicillium canariense]|uniref:Sulfate anion transporter n=1 Tax=Penicillium canariense TaxID=189055 RepID=A0A9W9HWN9_9EURO|nr:sulfate anion transporter [Penicillium canariense]KAJ5157700.1 sulfate anion transporter [Penicillium canariense]